MSNRRVLALCAALVLPACSPDAGEAGGAGPAPTPPVVQPGTPGNQTPDPAPAPTTPPSTPAPTTTNPPPPVTTPPVTTPPPPTTTPPVTTPTPDPAPTTPPAVTPPAGPDDPKSFSCSLVIGIAATGQWFGAGFEKIVDNTKWELLAVHSGFVQGWADPNSDFWSKAPSSACATNAKTPDRVILSALYLHWMDASVEEWVKVLDETVATFKAKNPNLKRLELTTFVRAPGNKPCSGSMPFKSWIKPEQDMAYDLIAAKYPDLVRVSPKFEVKTCGDFGGNPPHFTGAGATATAKMIADYYNGGPSPVPTATPAPEAK